MVEGFGSLRQTLGLQQMLNAAAEYDRLHLLGLGGQQQGNREVRQNQARAGEVPNLAAPPGAQPPPGLIHSPLWDGGIATPQRPRQGNPPESRVPLQGLPQLGGPIFGGNYNPPESHAPHQRQNPPRTHDVVPFPGRGFPAPLDPNAPLKETPSQKDDRDFHWLAADASIGGGGITGYRLYSNRLPAAWIPNSDALALITPKAAKFGHASRDLYNVLKPYEEKAWMDLQPILTSRGFKPHELENLIQLGEKGMLTEAEQKAIGRYLAMQGNSTYLKSMQVKALSAYGGELKDIRSLAVNPKPSIYEPSLRIPSDIAVKPGVATAVSEFEASRTGLNTNVFRAIANERANLQTYRLGNFAAFGGAIAANMALDHYLFAEKKPSVVSDIIDFGVPLAVGLTSWNPCLKFGAMVGGHVLNRLLLDHDDPKKT